MNAPTTTAAQTHHGKQTSIESISCKTINNTPTTHVSGIDEYVEAFDVYRSIAVCS